MLFKREIKKTLDEDFNDFSKSDKMRFEAKKVDDHYLDTMRKLIDSMETLARHVGDQSEEIIHLLRRAHVMVQKTYRDNPDFADYIIRVTRSLKDGIYVMILASDQIIGILEDIIDLTESGKFSTKNSKIDKYLKVLNKALLAINK